MASIFNIHDLNIFPRLPVHRLPSGARHSHLMLTRVSCYYNYPKYYLRFTASFGFTALLTLYITLVMLRQHLSSTVQNAIAHRIGSA